MESTKNSDIRINNRKRIVNMLFRQGQMTKQELSQRLDISLPTVNLLLKELTEKGLVTKGKVLDSTGGRKPVCHMPVYDARFSIGAEASSQGLRVVLMDLGSNIVKKGFYPIARCYTQQYWKKVNDVIMGFAGENVPDMKKLLDIGITLNVPMQDGQVIWKGGKPEASGEEVLVPEKCFDLPVKFRNSTKMAAVAQIWSGREQGSFVFVSLGESVRGALVHDSLVMDFSNINGEFGNMIINIGQERLRAGEFFSITSLCKRAEKENIQTFFEAVGRKERLCVEQWYEYLDQLCVFLHNLYCIFGWRLVIGGSLSAWLEPYKAYMEQKLKDLYDICDGMQPCISISSLGEYGAAVGAAMLPVDDFLEFGYDKL